MASTTASSPGALLLRSSRMFSLPTTLKRPPASPHLKASTTHPYPTTQSIETDFTSRLHGDWGFKRPLPTHKTANKTHSFVRVHKIDTCEGITDFASANDHTISLRKWHEMGTPITMPSPAEAAAIQPPGQSVFEEHLDYTDIPPPKPESLLDDTGGRWRYTGPVLGSISQGKFDQYLAKKVAPRQEDFRAFVRAHLAAQMTAEDARHAMAAGELPAEPVKPSDISDEMLMAGYRELREDKSQLFAIMQHFLDLPPIQLGDGDNGSLAGFDHKVAKKVSYNPWAKLGAPKTHPSMGMMYSRSASYLDNDPYGGPQKNRIPIPARVICPGTSANPNAILGVAGWAVSQRSREQQSSRSTPSKMAEELLTSIDPHSETAGKLWVRIAHASPTPNGRLKIVIDHASQSEIYLARERRCEMAPWEKARSAPRPATVPGRTPYQTYARPGDSDSYGLGI